MDKKDILKIAILSHPKGANCDTMPLKKQHVGKKLHKQMK